MKFLFIFAHPDDETVACGGTIRLLANAGHECKVVSVTAGDAGSVTSAIQKQLDNGQELANIRKKS